MSAVSGGGSVGEWGSWARPAGFCVHYIDLRCSEVLFAGDEEKLKDRNGRLPLDVDESMLHAAGAEYFEVVQNNGEVLFVPSGWHHQVWNLVSCSVIFVNENENGEKWENNEFVNEN